MLLLLVVLLWCMHLAARQSLAQHQGRKGEQRTNTEHQVLSQQQQQQHQASEQHHIPALPPFGDFPPQQHAVHTHARLQSSPAIALMKSSKLHIWVGTVTDRRM
jgi:hypothetical protein